MLTLLIRALGVIGEICGLFSAVSAVFLDKKAVNGVLCGFLA